MKPQRILVTGGAGFIGSHTVDLLLKEGREVTVLDDLSSGKLTNLDKSNNKLKFIEGSILDKDLVLSLVKESDAVLHLAALASVPASIKDPVYSMQVNTQGLVTILQAMHHLNSHARLVYASSAAVYGNSKTLPCAEDTLERPLSPYALQKINCEEYASLFDLMHGIKSLGLRYFNVYGERQDPSSPYSGVISKFLDAYHQGKDFVVYGDGNQSRDFIHVSDVAAANLKALDSDCATTMNIATGVPQTLNDLISFIEDAGEKKASYSYTEARAGDIHSSYAATERAQKLLSFHASVSLKDGIAGMVQKH